MLHKLNNFFTSGWEFTEYELDVKSRLQMINVALILSSFAFIYGIIINTINNIPYFAEFEASLLLINIIMFLLLRKNRNILENVAMIITAQCTILLLMIIYKAQMDTMKYLWLFTYPIVLLYFQKRNNGIYWFVFLLIMLIIAPVQGLIEVDISLFEVMYISVVLIIISVIVFFYQIKMNEARDLILIQQDKLKSFNIELEKQVKDKTLQLQELNESLEMKVKEKAKEINSKEAILQAQSKQAVMGEMISMIAHQWRQPLSTITLQIANLQFKKLLGQDTCEEDTDNALSEISDTIVYLSDTVDDFQTYFRPDKNMIKSEVYELLDKAVNFANPRLQECSLNIKICTNKNIYLKTYPNELIQVILNILNNAIDAIKELNKQNSFININVKEENNFITIDIADNAGGIEKENLSKLFEPYFSTKGKNGTGLGLYMSKMIIEKQFNGMIEVESSRKGSIFSIKIPKNL